MCGTPGPDGLMEVILDPILNNFRHKDDPNMTPNACVKILVFLFKFKALLRNIRESFIDRTFAGAD